MYPTLVKPPTLRCQHDFSIEEEKSRGIAHKHFSFWNKQTYNDLGLVWSDGFLHIFMRGIGHNHFQLWNKQIYNDLGLVWSDGFLHSFMIQKSNIIINNDEIYGDIFEINIRTKEWKSQIGVGFELCTSFKTALLH